ncbi:hypothetical protein ACFYVR_16155 [Rhodococcus sp. NPDC003318]|uniref:hypothetical protein n=1 Tax=Rhodococcus sp. NPDC003318 TaxID=3364503 RepID=UPI00367B27DF
MTIADQLDALLAAADARLTNELHTPGQPAARSYARALWQLQDDVRALATRIRLEGDQS